MGITMGEGESFRREYQARIKYQVSSIKYQDWSKYIGKSGVMDKSSPAPRNVFRLDQMVDLLYQARKVFLRVILP
jgi:hypothetical protein